MSELYEVTVASAKEATIVLDVLMVHPDAGFPKSKDFARRLVLDSKAGALAKWREDAVCDDVAAKKLSAKMIRSVAVDGVRRYVEGWQTQAKGVQDCPVARYVIVLHDRQWAQALKVKKKWVSTAYGGGPFVKQATAPAVSPDTRMRATQTSLRGTILRTATTTNANRTNYVLVAFDYGLTTWFAREHARIIKRKDTYERAWAAPEEFFQQVFDRKPMDRSKCFADFAASTSAQQFPAYSNKGWIPDDSQGLFALLARLPDRGVKTALQLLEDWSTDAVSTKKGRNGHAACWYAANLVAGALAIVCWEAAKQPYKLDDKFGNGTAARLRKVLAKMDGQLLSAPNLMVAISKMPKLDRASFKSNGMHRQSVPPGLDAAFGYCNAGIRMRGTTASTTWY